jgi:cysteinyl-tRNA synthetase
MLYLYNTLTQKKEQFISLQPKKVGLYVCGMTVYDHCHIGHARVWVVFDILIRHLAQQGFEVNYVRNITDVDDKIIYRAQKNQQTIAELTQHTIRSMHEDMAALHLQAPAYEPRATDHITAMIQLIERLIEKGAAYQANSGDVYYAVNQFKPYGQLTHQDLSALMSGARVAVDQHKHHPLDFVLWKKAEPTDSVYWESPWGIGRPGWHIECSAMALTHLGDSFDIHGGGADLKFPHHQNEIAQSEAVTQKPFARTWMHVGFVNINEEKMSKSKGNALTIKSLLNHYPGEVIRYFLLTSHYRSPIHYTESHLKTAQKALKRLYEATSYVSHSQTARLFDSTRHYESAFYNALNDDLNTPIALSILFDMTHTINRLGSSEEAIQLAHQLKKLGGALGLLQQSSFNMLHKSEQTLDNAWIEEKIVQRNRARKDKAWAIADTIRQELLENNIVLEDTAEGTRWKLMD